MITFIEFVSEHKSSSEIEAKVRKDSIKDFKEFERAYHKKHGVWPKSTQYKPLQWKSELKKYVD